MSTNNFLLSLITAIFAVFTSCSEKEPETKDSVVFQHDIINEKLISYDTLIQEISLPMLSAYQKSISIGKILSDKYPQYTTYLVEIQERVDNVFTVILYIYEDNIHPTYLLNYKNFVLIDYIYHNGSYVYDVVEDISGKEIIHGYQRWFEFHQDTVFKIENNIQDDYYIDTGIQIERSKESIITKYKIEKNGMFKKIK